MKVDLKCFSTLADPDSCSYEGSTTYELEDGQTVADLADRAGIARDKLKIAFVNNRKSEFDTVLRDGDRVGLAPSTGGM